MATIPFIGRLRLLEYLGLLVSFTLLFLETLIRSITLLLPAPVIRFFYRLSRRTFNALSTTYSRRQRQKKKGVSDRIAKAQDFVELCELWGYVAEEHIVQTGDGYLLGLHRLGWRRGEEERRVNAGEGSVQKKVVYLHHGLLMNSEVWVCLTEKERCLPFFLVDQGYDVWLGNNRGNKYSKKCLHYPPTDVRFWNFSMDQFAFHDIPDSINYILSTTGQPSLSYIGFSQGTAQAFATLSIHPTLNSKVDCFIALAPAMAPPGLASGIVASLCKSNPEVLFLAFGRRAILGSATMWSALLYPALFVWFIDKSIQFLFGWQTRNIAISQKLAAYPHLYSFTSTKSVVHWFQIIRNGTFQMYDDETTTPLAVGNSAKYYKVAKFPTRNIKTPIVLVYGGSDSLVDIRLMLKELPRHTVARGIGKYEHLDLLWASDVDRLVFPHVLEALEAYGVPERTKREALGWRTVDRGIMDRAGLARQSPTGSQPPGYSEDERGGQEISGNVAAFDFGVDGDTTDLDRPSTAGTHMDETDLDEGEDDDGGPEQYALTPSRLDAARSGAHQGLLPATRQAVRAHPNGSSHRSGSSPESERTVIAEPSSSRPKAHPHTKQRRLLSPRARAQREEKRASQLSETNTIGSPLASGFTGDSAGSRRSGPEGWWSSTNTSSAEGSPSASRMPLALPAAANEALDLNDRIIEDGSMHARTDDGEDDLYDSNEEEQALNVEPDQPVRLTAKAESRGGLLGNPSVAVTTGVFRLGEKRKSESDHNDPNDHR